MSVHVEVADATGAILSVMKNADIGAMTIFGPQGGGEIVKDVGGFQTKMNMTLEPRVSTLSTRTVVMSWM